MLGGEEPSSWRVRRLHWHTRKLGIGGIECGGDPLCIGDALSFVKVTLNPNERIKDKVVVVKHGSIRTNAEAWLFVIAAHVAG